MRMLHRTTPAARRAHALAASMTTHHQLRRAMHALPVADVRARFLQFFEANGHRVVPSSSLVPPGSDTSLLFTNAGMVPFKQCFLGTEQRPYVRATSAQRCVRAGGKHNDLDQVGLTRRHHTLFEMLGNFSFGDYFKEDAIAFSWQFLTKELGLPKDRLHVTVLNSDDEARQLWKKVAQLSDNKIISHDEEENFWAMGDSGPCGPCSEIFWDLGDHIADPDERFLELWNLVFMQFFRNEGDLSGSLHPLPKPSVDTGMGLERIASVLQNVPSNYHTDAFVPLMGQVVAVMDRQRSRKHLVANNGRSFADVLEEELDPQAQRFGVNQQIQTVRIVSDHLKASYAMLSDGIFPSNVGRGYVLRRIIRRAIRHAQNCGVEGAFLSKIQVPEWENAPGFAQMRSVISNEEKAFEEMLSNGKRAMEKVFSSANGKMIPGVDAFRLYDTYGIPLDITQVLAEERGITVDAVGFEACLEDHKRKASESSAFASHHGDVNASASSSGSASPSGSSQMAVAGEFVGYESLNVHGAGVLSVWSASDKKQAAASFWVSIDRSPFYAEGGGQVIDTKRLPANDAIGLHCSLPEGMQYTDVEALLTASGGVQVDAHVNKKFRAGCQVHHSATHMLQRALKQVLGDHVTQCGSFVTTDRLRFDFAHFGALSLDEMARVELLVNEMAAEELAVQTLELPRDQAEQSGAICNFGEKYGDVVRVVKIGAISSEFCGGTHVQNASSIFPFVILSEGSVAAGTRRMEAVAGIEGAKHLQTKDKTLQSLAVQLETTPAKVPERITKMQKQMKQLESYAQSLGDLLAAVPSAPIAQGRIDGPMSVDSVQFHEFSTGGSCSCSDFVKVLRRRAEFLLQNAPEHVHVVVMGSQIVCISDGKSANAGKLLQQMVKPLGGRGGGNASFAQGSLPADTAPTALELAHKVLK
ncbi:Alanine-trna ligase [Globisporangium polare]